ncbi:MAG TPA: MotA/TolQ/ExbB proton channel family protein [Thermoanaerobaculia bacterium]|nr:MotA/TolQ/ExbB proton channel family protein [Thermoanaerobaculia bacterium]
MPDLSGLSLPGLEGASAVGLAVFVLLFFLSVWSVGVSIERLIVFARARRQSIAFARVLAEQRRPDWLDEAVETAGKYPHSHLARVVSAGLLTFRQKRAKKALSKAEVREAVERSLERSSVATLNDLRRGIAGLATIATTAPFVGLFGTVIGIIHAFEDIASAKGAGGFETVSQGIAEALVATALGLVVAIPAAWMFNYLSGRIERLNAEMENSSSELLDFFLDLDEGAEA